MPAWKSENEKEAGQAMIELALVLPLFIILAAGVLYFGKVLYAYIAADMASYDCVRTAAEALHPGNGQAQGRTAAIDTLRGFYMSGVTPRVRVDAPNGWKRGREVRCRVDYGISLAGMPLIGMLDTPQEIHIQSDTKLRIEQYKSRWD